jgi:phosphatidylserine/phosphatidylglycerophosphate/cardiolipin synthase-like enzyme
MDLLVQRATAGAVNMQGIVDSSSVSDAAPLVCANLPLRKDGNGNGKLHHKVFIFDQSIVVIGSFNFSNNGATRNDENMLVVHSPALAQVYLEEFNKRWAESEVATTTCPG